MNIGYILNTLGKLIFFEGLMLTLPLAVALLYGENNMILPYLLLILGMLIVGALSFLFKPKSKTLRMREGLVIAGISWVAVSILGALPLFLSGDIRSYLDAVFEIVSGFTTTGSSCLTDVEALSHANLFWRSFTNWIGGMGVLVFILAFLPATDPQSIHILRAEMPGPQVGKLVSKLRMTARLLYVIYLVMTAIETILLLCGGLPLFDSLVTSFATAGTGGFSIRNASMAAYENPYAEIVVALFMLLFSVNFNLYYLLLVGDFRSVCKNEELRWFLGLVLVAVGLITIDILPLYESNFGTALRTSFFQVSSIISTSGFATANFNVWPSFSKTILVLLMFIGGCSGSTCGGMKISRMVVMLKNAWNGIKKQIFPNSVALVRLEGKTVDETTRRGISAYLSAFAAIFAVSLLLISLNGFDLTTNFTAVATCIGNVGPGLGMVGPVGNFSAFSPLSKIVLIFDMLAGRLEFFPILALLYPKAWKRY